MIYQVNQLPHAIPIGVQTENGVEAIQFAVSAWQLQHGMMEYSVWATRPGEDVAYEVQHTELMGSILYWYPDEVDTSIAGVGKVEVKAVTEDKRKLSGFCETVVQPSSIAMTQDPPKVVIPWLEEIKESAEEARKNADRAEAAADNLSGGAVTGSVRYDKPQQLTEAQKAQARANIGAGTGSGSGDGTPGEDGGYYLPAVSDGVLSWQPSKEGMPQAPVTEIRGPKGDKGDPGNDGDTRVYVGSDTPPVGAEVWIDPQGVVEEDEIPGVKVEETEEGVMITAVNWDGVTTAVVKHGKDAEGSSVSVDNTLTVSGAAADAKVTGDKFKALTEEIAKLPTGGGGGAIIDVAELPTDDINEDVFYRLLTARFCMEGEYEEFHKCYAVYGLPEIGEPAANMETGELVAYYDATSKTVNGYMSAELAAAFGIDEGWYPAELLFQVAGVEYGGIITNVADSIGGKDALFVVLEYVLYQYTAVEWEQVKGIGSSGDGFCSAVFNMPTNVASGRYSLAEGLGTDATGESSHAEGRATKAQGEFSHAEGWVTKAQGVCSHAEGKLTIAQGDYQHVSGTNNIPDEDSLVIVGNGFAHGGVNDKSNAYKLDREGNGWFAGKVECNSIILTSSGGFRWELYVDDAGALRTETASQS